MNQIRLSIAVILLILFCACKKQHNDSSSISGTWELRNISGQIILNYLPGNGTQWKFADDRYEFYQSDTLKKSGVFELVSDGSVSESVCLNIPAGQYSKRIVFDNRSDSVKVFIQITGDTLSMISGCYAYDGGHTDKYVKN